MEHILHDFNEVVISLMKEYLESAGDKDCLSDFTDNLNNNLMNFGVKVTTFVITELEKIIFESKERKEEYMAIDIETRKLIAIFGELVFSRRYYENKLTKEKVHLLDKYLGIESRERILPNVEERVLNEATESSYQKAGRKAAYGIELTKQTVKNKVAKIDIKEPIHELETKKKVKRLFIEADEDHVPLQRGGIEMPLLVTVYEDKINRKISK